jgi:hypothetical protein
MPDGPGSADRGKGRRRRSNDTANGGDADYEDASAAAAAPPPASSSGPLDFGTYMAVKAAKLREQFDELRAEKVRGALATATSDIFRGVVIHVNGITVPCALVRPCRERI